MAKCEHCGGAHHSKEHGKKGGKSEGGKKK